MWHTQNYHIYISRVQPSAKNRGSSICRSANLLLVSEEIIITMTACLYLFSVFMTMQSSFAWVYACIYLNICVELIYARTHIYPQCGCICHAGDHFSSLAAAVELISNVSRVFCMSPSDLWEQSTYTASRTQLSYLRVVVRQWCERFSLVSKSFPSRFQVVSKSVLAI